MSCFDNAYDIFVLDNHVYSEYFDNYITNAVIRISYKNAKNSNMPVGKNYFYCNKCKLPTYYLWGNGKEFICPTCVNKEHSCNTCAFHIGCYSCSGVSKNMVNVLYEDKTILLCLNDKCLMPFGYQTQKYILCSCEIDSLNLMNNILPDDIVRHKIFPFLFSKLLDRESYILGDLTMSDKNKCLGCQLECEYITINKDDICNGNENVCKCYNSIYT